MGVVIAFFVGYVLGTRAGREGMEQFIDAIEQIAESDEVRGLVATGAGLVGSPLRELLLPNDKRARSGGSFADVAADVFTNFSRRVA